MFEDIPFDAAITRLRCGDETAVSEVFRRYVRRPIALAGKQLDT
jgi:hypothetical protein